MKNFEFDHIRNLIDESGLILVTSHFNPDGDAIGASLAMASILRNRGKEVCVIVPNDYPSFLKWMPGNDKVVIFRNDEAKAMELIRSADLIFCLDYSALNRTDKMEDPIRQAKAKRILIDHHLEPVLDDFDYYLSVVQTSSTSELVFEFARGCSWLSFVDREAATAFYVGIMTDTGSFSFACNYPETFRITAFLIETGIDPEQIHRLVYDTYSEDRLRLLGFCLSEKLTVVPELSTAYIALSKAELERFHHQVGDTEGIVNYALSIENIKIAVLLTERKDRIRLSFRSKGDMSVNTIAREHFNGGGHRNAAGGDSFVSLENTITRMKDVLLQYKAEIDRSSI